MKGAIVADEKGLLRGAGGDLSSSRTYLGMTLALIFAWFVSNLWGPWDLWVFVVPAARRPADFELAFLGALVLYFTLGAYGKDAMRHLLPQVGSILARLGSRGGGGGETYPRTTLTIGDPEIPPEPVIKSEEEQEP